MTTTIESVAGGIRVTGEMTVYTASQVKQPLLDAVAEGPPDIQLELSGVSDFDTAGVQLLLMVHREALAGGRNIKFAAPSGIVREVLTLFGALGLLMGASDLEGRP